MTQHGKWIAYGILEFPDTNLSHNAKFTDVLTKYTCIRLGYATARDTIMIIRRLSLIHGRKAHNKFVPEHGLTTIVADMLTRPSRVSHLSCLIQDSAQTMDILTANFVARPPVLNQYTNIPNDPRDRTATRCPSNEQGSCSNLASDSSSHRTDAATNQCEVRSCKNPSNGATNPSTWSND